MIIDHWIRLYIFAFRTMYFHRLIISDPSKKESYRYLRNLSSRQK